MKSINKVVTTTAAVVIAADDFQRTCYIHVIGNGTVYIGGDDVTSANGLLTEKHAVPLELVVPAKQTVWAVVASDTENVRILTPDVD
jgi:hypothetical protein